MHCSCCMAFGHTCLAKRLTSERWKNARFDCLILFGMSSSCACIFAVRCLIADQLDIIAAQRNASAAFASLLIKYPDVPRILRMYGRFMELIRYGCIVPCLLQRRYHLLFSHLFVSTAMTLIRPISCTSVPMIRKNEICGRNDSI